MALVLAPLQPARIAVAHRDLEDPVLDGVAHGEERIGVAPRIWRRDEECLHGLDRVDGALAERHLIVRKFLEEPSHRRLEVGVANAIRSYEHDEA